VFLYVCFGIPGIEGMFLEGVNIHQLLLLNGNITDEQVKKMIWVVCNFNHYLTNIGADSNKEQFIQSLNDAYDNPNRDYTPNSIEIAKSIATLVVRVFVAFQMRINLGDGDGAAAEVVAEEVTPAEAPVAQNLLDPQQQAEITAELNRDLEGITPAQIVTEPNTAVVKTIGKIGEGTEPPSSTRRISDRVRLLNEAIGKAAAERERKAEQVKREAEAAKQIKIQEELARLQECIASFGQSI
jgi:hypothetical protein